MINDTDERKRRTEIKVRHRINHADGQADYVEIEIAMGGHLHLLLQLTPQGAMELAASLLTSRLSGSSYALGRLKAIILSKRNCKVKRNYVIFDASVVAPDAAVVESEE